MARRSSAIFLVVWRFVISAALAVRIHRIEPVVPLFRLDMIEVSEADLINCYSVTMRPWDFISPYLCPSVFGRRYKSWLPNGDFGCPMDDVGGAGSIQFVVFPEPHKQR